MKLLFDQLPDLSLPTLADRVDALEDALAKHKAESAARIAQLEITNRILRQKFHELTTRYETA